MRDATLASNVQSRELLSVGLRRNAALSPLTEKVAPKSSSDEIVEGLTFESGAKTSNNGAKFAGFSRSHANIRAV